MQTALIGFFGALGVLCRHFVDLGIGKDTIFPLSTLVINCSGSLLIGVLYVLGGQLDFLPRELTAALTIGFIGGFTTFSAFSLQTILLMEQKQLLWAFIYFVGSPLSGALFAFLGISLARVILSST